MPSSRGPARPASARMITISTRVRQFERILALIERGIDDVFGSVGTHCHHAAEEDDVPLEDDPRRSPAIDKVVAIGEAGLDYHYDFSPRDAQARGFRKHIAAARAYRPAARHPCPRSRRGHRRHSRGGDGEGARSRAVLHCFSSGRRAGAARRSRSGFYVSFSGILTFKKSEELRDIARIVPRDRLLVETDAPYLAPMPFRGKRNEPAYVAEHGACPRRDDRRRAMHEIAGDHDRERLSACFRECLARMPGGRRPDAMSARRRDPPGLRILGRRAAGRLRLGRLRSRRAAQPAPALLAAGRAHRPGGTHHRARSTPGRTCASNCSTPRSTGSTACSTPTSMPTILMASTTCGCSPSIKRRLVDIHADQRTAALLRMRFAYCFETPPGSQLSADPDAARARRPATRVSHRGCRRSRSRLLPFLQRPRRHRLAWLSRRWISPIPAIQRPASMKASQLLGGSRHLDRRCAEAAAASEPLVARRSAGLDRAAQAQARHPDQHAHRPRLSQPRAKRCRTVSSPPMTGMRIEF